jgi:hypothetical protein
MIYRERVICGWVEERASCLGVDMSRILAMTINLQNSRLQEACVSISIFVKLATKDA